jgi:AraC-like DNA-binding protein
MHRTFEVYPRRPNGEREASAAAATDSGVLCTVLQLDPDDLHEAPDSSAGGAADEAGQPCDVSLPAPGEIRRLPHDTESPAANGLAVLRELVNDDESGVPASCRQPQRWLAFARSVICELERLDPGADEPARGKPAAYVMIVAPISGSGPGAFATGPAPLRHPQRVERAIKIMEADPAAIIRMADLAHATNVSVRTLQAAFRQHTGASPMGYLRQLRLTRVHEDLLAADPRYDTVARIANRWGFPHLGRFAATYRAKYGYNPSSTLQRGPSSGEDPPDPDDEPGTPA